MSSSRRLLLFQSSLSLSQSSPSSFPSYRPSICTLSASDHSFIFQPSPLSIHRPPIPPSLSSTLPTAEQRVSHRLSTRRSFSHLLPPSPSPPPPSKIAPFPSHSHFIQAVTNLRDDPLECEGGQIVTYRGNPTAEFMVIGEAPGQEEDRLGKPFVGKAGKLLDKILQYGGFNVNTQVYITNVVKRRPNNNRTPTDLEIDYYVDWLKEEIRLVQPKLIMLAGSVAAKALLGKQARITQIRGEWFRYESQIDLMAVYHPAYLLRKPRAKYDMVIDIEAIRARFLTNVHHVKLDPLIKNS